MRIRRWMAIVFLVALTLVFVLETVRLIRYRDHYLELLNRNTELEANVLGLVKNHEGYINVMMNEVQIGNLDSAQEQSIRKSIEIRRIHIPKLLEIARYYDGLKHKYRAASLRPWAFVDPDSPTPTLPPLQEIPGPL